MKVCTKEDERMILGYIGNDFAKCAYLYIDLKKYGFDDENVFVWRQENEAGEICALCLQYYNGMQLYSKDGEYDVQDVANLIKERKPKMVVGMGTTVSQLGPFFPDKEIEYGKVIMADKETYTGIYDPEAELAKREDMEEIVDLLKTDEVMGGPYPKEMLLKQMTERFDTGFGRNFVIRNEERKIVGHVATYAELDNMGVISGGILVPELRGKNKYALMLGSLCKSLLSEGKIAISYFYHAGASAHKNAGFQSLGDWAKLAL